MIKAAIMESASHMLPF